ncbi:DUF952 domain containing protein [Nitzschia inconspicua]|uniref:DUF952 domain containing protein n=1 Tax=Nitzschia inconspicua TaxID=303405 RepID=A0A9K3L110_9STRA|nr:DUF952 domain containing protein [Nitzschia inconspicua]
MPKIIGKSVTVVQDGGLCIDEFAGNVATKDDTLSIARVVVSKPASEPWLTLDYDEWICVVRGKLNCIMATCCQRCGPLVSHVPKGVMGSGCGQWRSLLPPTFEADGGFTHATAVAERLIETANHFYTSSQGDWICLELSKEALKKVGIITRFEEAKPVGDTATGTQWSSWVCPHIFGGIPTQLSGIVTNIYPMKRDSEGTFLSIEGVSK